MIALMFSNGVTIGSCHHPQLQIGELAAGLDLKH